MNTELKDLRLTDNFQCRDYHGKNWNSSYICNFINVTDDCQIDDGFINYLKFAYCSFVLDDIWIACILLGLLLFFLFIGLGVTADTFFCPSLRVIADSMKLSQNVAGVTFLAFGNGAPDVFSAIAAISNAKDGDAGLAFGALFGAGVFVSTVVAGLICIVRPFQSVQRPLLRDLIFFMIAGFWAFVIVWDGKISLWETIGFLTLYVVYILVVVLGRYVNQRMRLRNGEVIRNAFSSDNVVTRPNVINESENEEEAQTRPLLIKEKRNSNADSVSLNNDSQKAYTYTSALLATFVPYDTEEWKKSNGLFRLMTIIKAPVFLVLKLTIPLVDYEAPNHNWNKVTYAINCLLAPLFMVFAIKFGLKELFNAIPYWSVALVIGFVGFVCILYFTELNTKPRLHWLYSYFGFLVSVVWIYTIANEIVNLLTAFGVIFNISNTILGLTFLAWGNSLSDLVADLFSAKNGYPDMGMSACFGGPLFNILLGIGIPFSIKCIKGGDFTIQKSFLQNILALFLGISLVSTLIAIPLNKFKFTRAYGYYLLIVYTVFITVCILIESGVIHSPA